MTQPQSLNVEYRELMARADELEAPIEGMPELDPQPPSALPMVIRAAQQLGYSAENLRFYLRAGEEVRKELAESLRNAAKAYDEVDEEAAQVVNTGSTSAIAPRTFLRADSGVNRVDAGVNRVDAGVDRADWDGDTPPGAGEWWSDYFSDYYDDYFDVKRAAYAIVQYDQGLDVDQFALQWLQYRQALLGALDRFRPFEHWEGDAADAVESNFDQQRVWTNSMAQLCFQLGDQARILGEMQRWACTEHPDYEEIVVLEDQYWATGGHGAGNTLAVQQKYVDAVQLSEEVLAQYKVRANLPLPPVDGTKPPRAYEIDPPPEPQPESDTDIVPASTGIAGAGLLEDDEMPELLDVPTASGGVPAMPDEAALADAAGVPGLATGSGAPGLPTGSGVKPASLGGGGGAPSTPLQPPFDAEAARAAGAAAGAGAGRGVPGVGGATGGGMGGMPMGGGPGGGQSAEKESKRKQGDDEEIYTEDRPWTESIIGIRLQKDTSGQ